MQQTTFHPVVADIAAHVVQIGISSLKAGERASTSLTGLAPAGADEVSMQAVAAFEYEAAALLALNKAAQEELIRAGDALMQIAQSYIDLDESAATQWYSVRFRHPSLVKRINTTTIHKFCNTESHNGRSA